MLRNSVALAAVLVLASCGSTPDLGDAGKMVETFHVQLDAEDYDGIWATTSPDFRKASRKEDLQKFLTAVHTKLGKVRESKQITWQKMAHTSGSFTKVVMDTRFEKGTGQEEFMFQAGDNRTELSGYHINSTDMMIN
jgi:hypothetical protein